MAIAPLNIPANFQSQSLDFSPLANLGQIYQKAQNEQKLSDLGRGLADGTMDYRQAAAATANMGDLTHSLQFLALSEAKQKQALQRQSSTQFNAGIGGLFGAQPNPEPANPDPTPVLGARGAIPAVAPGSPIPSSSRVVGDAEGVSSGLYDAPVTQGARPSVQMADATVARPGEIGAQHIPFLIKSLSDPNALDHQKDVAKIMLTEAFKNAKEPEKIQTLRALQANPALLNIEQSLRAKTEVNIDQKGESEFEKEFGKDQAKRWNGYIAGSQKAQTNLADIGTMRQISDRLGSQGAAANIKESLGPYAESLGIPVAGLSDIQVYSSIVQKMAPTLHVAGTGSQSDIEFKGLMKSMPQLMSNPEARSAILDTMEAGQRNEIARGDIATRLATKEITRGDAEKQLRALGDPLQTFREWRKANPSLYGQALKGDGSAAPSPISVEPKEGVAKQVPSTRVEIDQSLANARAAIAKNPAVREGVIKRLRDAGLDASGL